MKDTTTMMYHKQTTCMEMILLMRRTSIRTQEVIMMDIPLMNYHIPMILAHHQVQVAPHRHPPPTGAGMGANM